MTNNLLKLDTRSLVLGFWLGIEPLSFVGADPEVVNVWSQSTLLIFTKMVANFTSFTSILLVK